MAETTPRAYSSDPTLYLYTSLTAGSSHIVTATSRLETILKANRIPFQALDVATDEKARMLWGRRSKGKKLPGLVRYGLIVGDLEEVEEWNEYGELKQQIGSTAPAASSATPSASASNTPSKAPLPPAPSAASTTNTPSKATAIPAPSADDPVAKITSHETNDNHITFKDEVSSKSTTTEESDIKKEETPSIALALRQAGAEAAKKAGEKKAEKNAAFKSSLSKSNEGASDTTASQLLPPEIKPTPAQVRNAPSPIPEAITESVPEAEPTTKTSSTTSPANDDNNSPVMSPSTGGAASASLGGDPPPLHYSPKATPAVTSSSSLEVANEPEEAEHIREKSVQADTPKEVIEQVESEQTIPEGKEEEEGEEGKGK